MRRELQRVPANFQWHARPGCKIFVAGHGAVRFDFPSSWVVRAANGSVKFFDREPPDDESTLEVSCLLVPAIDWSGLPLGDVLEAVADAGRGSARRDGPLREEWRGGIELAWRETAYVDRATGGDALGRVCIARKGTVQCLLTYAFWASDFVSCDAAWDVVLETMVLDEYIVDPLRGPAARG